MWYKLLAEASAFPSEAETPLFMETVAGGDAGSNHFSQPGTSDAAAAREWKIPL